MWKKVLIANRGEIAVRIIRACREAGLQCVTVYSTADKTALHAEIADESVCIGPPSVQDSYLNMHCLEGTDGEEILLEESVRLRAKKSIDEMIRLGK